MPAPGFAATLRRLATMPTVGSQDIGGKCREEPHESDRGPEALRRARCQGGADDASADANDASRQPRWRTEFILISTPGGANRVNK